MTAHVLHDFIKTTKRHKSYGIVALLGKSLFALAWGFFFIGIVATQ